MDNFITCLDGDLTALIITGTPTEEELKDGWTVILGEYHELKGETPESSERLNLQRDITVMQNHLFLVQQCLDFLNARYSEEVAKGLVRLGYSFRPKSLVPDDYRPLLTSVASKARTKYIYLKQLIDQLEKQNQTLEDKRPDREYFETLLVHIEEMQGASYNMEALTVSKFITLEKKYVKQVEMIENQNQKHGG